MLPNGSISQNRICLSHFRRPEHMVRMTPNRFENVDLASVTQEILRLTKNTGIPIKLQNLCLLPTMMISLNRA